MPASAKNTIAATTLAATAPLEHGNGENAQWIGPKPRDFSAAIFKCDSTPTGTLPTNQNLYNAIARDFYNSNMPHWESLFAYCHFDLIPCNKTFSSKAPQRRRPVTISDSEEECARSKCS